MSDHVELKQIEAELSALRTRIDALNDSRLDGVIGRLVGVLAELRPISRSDVGTVHRFGR